MRYQILQALRKKLYFTVADFAQASGVTTESARVSLSRYVKAGIFIRLKKNLYVLEQAWEDAPRDFFFRISNFLQVPSYISLMSALSYYEITTQVPRRFYESVSLKRTRVFEPNGAVFNFYKLKKELYFDFVKKGNIFIATKEKAFVDALYLYSFGKYKVDFDSLSLEKLDKKEIARIIKVFPKKTKEIARKLCKI